MEDEDEDALLGGGDDSDGSMDEDGFAHV